MNKERLQEIKDSIDFQREFLIASNMQTLCVDEEMELYNEIIRLQQENQQLKKSIKLFTDDLANMTNRELQLEKQKDDVVEYIKKRTIFGEYTIAYLGILNQDEVRKILRMLGEIDD